jgi:hypothetical protein
MSHKTFLIAVVVVLLLATFITPALAASPVARNPNPVQPTIRLTPANGFLVFPPGLAHPNGDCEDAGNGSC